MNRDLITEEHARIPGVMGRLLRLQFRLLRPLDRVLFFWLFRRIRRAESLRRLGAWRYARVPWFWQLLWLAATIAVGRAVVPVVHYLPLGLPGWAEVLIALPSCFYVGHASGLVLMASAYYGRNL